MRPLRTLLVALVGAGALLGCGGGDDEDATEEAPEVSLDAVETERVGDFIHAIRDFDYPRPAPSGGDHLNAPHWLTCGVYEGVVPDELAVHSLEHGAVWIALGPDSTPADRAAAEALAEGEKVIVSDVPDLEDPVHMVAWGFRLRLESAEDPRAAAFVDAFVDAASARESGLSCESHGDPPTPPTLPVPG